VYAVLNSDGSVDEVASGNALLAAAAAIPSTGAAAPDVSNHWLLKVGPGNFDIGEHSLALLPYVDLEGSGMYTTTITGGPTSFGGVATIDCAGTSRITDLLVTNTGGLTVARALYVLAGKLYLNRVKALAMGGSSQNRGVLVVNGADLEMQESEAWAIGGNADALRIEGTVTSLCEIRNSYFVASSYAISNYTVGTVQMANSRINGTLKANLNGGHYSCYGNYNNAMNAAVNCPSP